MKSSLIHRARAFARQRHRGQLRKGDFRPFIVHPLAVAGILTRHRMPEEVVAAGLLHDVLEDTPTAPEELQKLFGLRVAGLVREVTEPDKKHPWEVRKNAYLRHLRRASRGALAISCADKLHNTLSLVAAYRREGPVVLDRFSRGIDQKLAYHRKVCAAVRQRWPACPILPELERALGRMEVVSSEQTAAEPKEVEVKFSVGRSAGAAAVLKKAEGLTFLGRFRWVQSGRERQVNRYWDTADFRLHQARAALKMRQVGRRAELTFKRELQYRAGVSERIEVTVPVPLLKIRRLLDREPFIEPVRRARKLIGRRLLEEVLTLRTDRRIRRFAFESFRIELALDRVEVLRSGRVVGSFREIELENLGVEEGAFREAVRDMKRQLGQDLRISRTPKYATGLRLLQ